MMNTTYFNTTSGRKQPEGLAPPHIPPPLHRHKRSQDWVQPNDALNLKSRSVNRRISEGSTTLAPRTFQSERVSEQKKQSALISKIDLQKLKEKCSAQSSKYTTPGLADESKNEVTPFSLEQKYSKIDTPVVYEQEGIKSGEGVKEKLKYEQMKERENLRVITKFSGKEEKSRNSETVLQEESSKRSGGAVIEEIENEIKQEIEVEAQKIPDNILVEESDDSKFMPMLLETSKSNEEEREDDFSEEQEGERRAQRQEIQDFLQTEENREEVGKEQYEEPVEEIYPKDSISELDKSEITDVKAKTEVEEEKEESVVQIQEEKEEKIKEIEMSPSVEAEIEQEEEEQDGSPKIEILNKKSKTGSIELLSRQELEDLQDKEEEEGKKSEVSQQQEQEERYQDRENQRESEEEEIDEKSEEKEEIEQEFTKDQVEEKLENEEESVKNQEEIVSEVQDLEVSIEEVKDAGNINPGLLKFPLSGAEVIQKSRNKISELEVQDLKNTEEVYYYRESSDQVLKEGDSIAYRYQLLEIAASYLRFTLYRCRDHKQDKEVVVRVQKVKWTKQAQQEKKLLDEHAQKSRLVEPQGMFYYRNMECWVYSLSIFEDSIVKKRRKVEKNLSNLAREMLRLIGSFHSNKIALCSFSPELIIDQSSSDSSTFKLKLLGFENHQAIFSDFEFAAPMLEDQEVASLSYIPPQLFLGLPTTQKIDMWCYGALLFDFLNQSSKLSGFQDFSSYFKKLVDALGIQADFEAYLEPATLKERLYSEEDQKFLYEGKEQTKQEGRVCNLVEKQGTLGDLIRKCVSWEVQRRVGVAEALEMLEEGGDQTELRSAVEESLETKEMLEQRRGSV